MNNESWALMAFGGGVLATCLAYARGIVWRLFSLMIVRAKMVYDHEAVMYYIWREMKHSPFGERRFSTCNQFVKTVSRYIAVCYEQASSDTMVFWQGWYPLLISLSGRHNGGVSEQEGLVLTFLRGTFDLEAFLIEAHRYYNSNHSGSGDVGITPSRFCVKRCFGSKKTFGMSMPKQPREGRDTSDDDITMNPEYRVLGWREDEIGQPKPETPWGALSFPDNVMEVIDDIRKWKKSEDWYKTKKISWRMGINIYGCPGTGKSSFARAIAQDLDMPIFVFDLSSFDNDEFVEKWHELLAASPAIALLEDIDAVFIGRDNRHDKVGGLSFDCLLNCMSGVEASEGVLIIVTTNNIQDLDPALGVPNEKGVSTRPGRIDRVVELTAMDERCRREVALRILSDCLDRIDEVVMAGDGESGAQFVDRCTKLALELYWDKTHPSVGESVNV